MEKFPCLAHAYTACATGGTLPCVLNAANEVAVAAFLKQEIAFVQIPEIIAHAMKAHQVVAVPEMNDILNADRWARHTAKNYIAFSREKVAE